MTTPKKVFLHETCVDNMGFSPIKYEDIKEQHRRLYVTKYKYAKCDPQMFSDRTLFTIP